MAQIRSLLFLQIFIFIAATINAFPEDISNFEQLFGTEIRREKRDVLKGKDHDLVNHQRSKRYIGRIPVAYMKKANLQHPYSDLEDEAAYSNGNVARQPVSHFREFTMGQRPVDGHHTQQRRFVPSYNRDDLDTSNLTDEEIQTLLLMLDGYELNTAEGRPRNIPQPNVYNVGKRETGKRTLGTTSGDGNKLEFLGNNARTKRVGTRHLMESNRVKKETDPSVLASLDRVFSDDNTHPIAGGILKPKAKKDIDWSNYLGIDKRTQHENQEQVKAAQVTTSPSSNPQPTVPNNNSKLVSVPLTSTTVTKTGKDSNKDNQERKENETVDKDDDRRWVLDEFYKNFAMMTNVKRKRESPSNPSETSNDLERLNELEQKMTQVGDKIIWDALKYTGSHRDQEMTPKELAKVKASVIDKLATAYSLEKVRDTVDELRQKLAALAPQA